LEEGKRVHTPVPGITPDRQEEDRKKNPLKHLRRFPSGKKKCRNLALRGKEGKKWKALEKIKDKDGLKNPPPPKASTDAGSEYSPARVRGKKLAYQTALSRRSSQRRKLGNLPLPVCPRKGKIISPCEKRISSQT